MQEYKMQGNKPTDKPTDTQAYCECFQKHRNQRIQWTPDGGVCQTCGLPMPTQHAGELPPRKPITRMQNARGVGNTEH